MGLLNTDAGKFVYIVPQSSYYYTTGTQDESAQAAEDNVLTGEQLGGIDSAGDLGTIAQKEDARLILSATTEFSKTEAAVSTNYPVSSSGSQGDHYRAKGPIIKFSGIISENPTTLFSGAYNIANELPNEAAVETYIAKIRETLRMLKEDNESQAYPLVNIHLPDNNSENNCLITNFTISRNKKLGNGYKVEITAQKLLIADSTFSVVPASDALQPKKQTLSDATNKPDTKPNTGVDLNDGAGL